MAEEEKYPQRRNIPLINRCINHYCALKKITTMRSLIGADAYDDIERNSQLGIILKFAGAGFTWASKHVQHLLGNMLEIAKHELWVLADGRPIRFSLHEFQHITQLNCGLPDPNDDLAAGDLWAEMGLTYGDGPNWAELDGVLSGCKDWSLEKRKMVGLLVVMFVAIFGLHINSRIPVFHAKLVMDPERFERYPWGRVAYDAIIKSLPSSSLQASRYTLHGFVHVLLIWAFEYIPHLGVMCGGRRCGKIPLMQWSSRNSRGKDIQEVFEADKKTSVDKKVRVVHLLEKPYEEIFPVWPGDDEDPKVDRMIQDILAGKLDESFWAIPTSRKRMHDEQQSVMRSAKRSKSKVKEPEKKKLVENKNANASRNATEKENLEIEPGMTLFEYVKATKGEKEKERLENQRIMEYEAQKQGEENNVMLKMMQTMKEAFDVMRFDQINTAERLSRMEEKKVDDAVTNERLRRIEEGMAQQNLINQRLLKVLAAKTTEVVLPLEDSKKSDVDQSKSSGSETQDGGGDDVIGAASDGANLKERIPEEQPTSTPSSSPAKPLSENLENSLILEQPTIHSKSLEIPFPTKSEKQRILQEQKNSESLSPTLRLPNNPEWTLEEEETSDPLSPVLRIVRNPEVRSNFKAPQQTYTKLSPTRDSQLAIISLNEDSECQFLERTIERAQENDLIYMEDLLPRPTRPRTLAANQKSPFEGSSVVRRLIDDEVAPNSYNPFGPVEKSKVARLRNIIRREIGLSIDDVTPLAEFYHQLLLPREDWPLEKYGWFTDLHMSSGMNIFRRRSMQTPSPYKSDRIVFLDHSLCAYWCAQYKGFMGNEKNYIFEEYFHKMYIGKAPIWCQTNKQWFRDIDTLYVAHNVSNTHWVALDIDLVKQYIKIYDSAISAVPYHELMNSVRPYARMIPYMVKRFAPKEMRKQMSVKAYTVYIVKSTPLNVQSGDCGIYTLKFIECLALGRGFKGLDDENIPFLRMKFGIDIMDELPLQETISLTDPNPRFKLDKEVLFTLSQGLLLDW